MRRCGKGLRMVVTRVVRLPYPIMQPTTNTFTGIMVWNAPWQVAHSTHSATQSDTEVIEVNVINELEQDGN